MADRVVGPMESSVLEAVAAMKWIASSDKAAVDLALLYAQQIDTFVGSEDLQLRSKGIYLGPHLLRALAQLGGTPTVRMQHELRSLKLAGTEDVDGQDGDEPSGVEQQSGNVSPIRPPKRGRSAG